MGLVGVADEEGVLVLFNDSLIRLVGQVDTKSTSSSDPAQIRVLGTKSTAPPQLFQLLGLRHLNADT